MNRSRLTKLAVAVAAAVSLGGCAALFLDRSETPRVKLDQEKLAASALNKVGIFVFHEYHPGDVGVKLITEAADYGKANMDSINKIKITGGFIRTDVPKEEATIYVKRFGEDPERYNEFPGREYLYMDRLVADNSQDSAISDALAAAFGARGFSAVSVNDLVLGWERWDSAPNFGSDPSHSGPEINTRYRTSPGKHRTVSMLLDYVAQNSDCDGLYLFHYAALESWGTIQGSRSFVDRLRPRFPMAEADLKVEQGLKLNFRSRLYRLSNNDVLFVLDGPRNQDLWPTSTDQLTTLVRSALEGSIVFPASSSPPAQRQPGRKYP